MFGAALAQTTTGGTDNTFLIGAMAGGVVFGIAGLFIWKNKGGSAVAGFLWGFFLGLIGLIVVLVAQPSAAKRKLEEEQRQRMSYQMQTGTGAWAGSTAAGAAAPNYPASMTSTLRACPGCGHRFVATLPECPMCRVRSEPWWENAGFWFTKNQAGQEYWLEPTRNLWLLYRRGALCPSCGQDMPTGIAVCPSCGVESNIVGTA